jgi:Cu-processing system ATP-binding protein
MDFVEEMAEDIIFLLDGHIHFKGSCFELKEKYHAAKLETAIAKMMMQTDVAPVGTHHDVSLQAQDRP